MWIKSSVVFGTGLFQNSLLSTNKYITFLWLIIKKNIEK